MKNISNEKPLSNITNQYDFENRGENYILNSQKNQNRDLSRIYLREKMGRYDKKAVVLDMGCGSGIDLKKYFEMGFINLIGIDPSDKLLTEAREILDDKITLKKGNFESIPMDTDSVDILVSRHALHYSKDLRKALLESARILKKDGKLLVVVSNPEADEMLPIDPDGCVTATLFNGKVSIKFPKHKLREYFSDEFKQNFQLLSKYEFSGNERDGSSDLIPNTLCFEASRK